MSRKEMGSSPSNVCPEDDETWLSRIKDNRNPNNKRSKIQKVPPMIRGANVKFYDPLVVSIGPYHHGKREFQLMEDHKYKMARKYTNNDDNKLRDLYIKVKNVAKDAKECYDYIKDNEDTVANFNDDDKFARMMFLDGCFVLHFINCITKDEGGDDLEIKNNILVCIKRDLLLLENQIPFLVLKELMPQSFDWKRLFNNFVEQFHGLPRKTQQQDYRVIEIEDIGDYDHLLEYTRKQLIGKPDNRKQRESWYSYRSAKELKTFGIHFRRSNTPKFTNVLFKDYILISVLHLPPITVDDSTKSMLLNMFAYEALPDSHPHDFEVTSYICFLDSLIDHAEDVKELRSKGIILNCLGSDQEVADLFNGIVDNLVPSPYAYAGIKEKIERHCKNKIKSWLAEWLHTHFTSPWTILAFIAAVFALVLSVIQTYKAMYPSPSK